MKDEVFDELVKSVKEGGRILQGRSDRMTDLLKEATPRPWVYAVNRNGRHIRPTLERPTQVGVVLLDASALESDLLLMVAAVNDYERLLAVERAAIRARDNLQVLMSLVHGAVKEEATEAWLELEAALAKEEE